jgi:hypothetical protein
MSDAVCANIGPRERRRRKYLGIVALVAGVVWVRFAWSLDFPPASRLAGFVFFHAGFTGILQAHAQTCIRLASKGLRNLDGGPESIQDAAELDAVRAQARRVLLHSLIAAAIVSAATLLLP